MFDQTQSVASKSWRWIGACAIALALANTPSAAVACTLIDNGSGTADLGDNGGLDCAFETRSGPLQITPASGALPPGSTIDFEISPGGVDCSPSVGGFCSLTVVPGVICEAAGGGLGGNGHCDMAYLELDITGTGWLAGFNRTISLDFDEEIHTAPRSPGSPVQVMASQIHRLEAELFGDPDFSVLRIRIGNAFGLPNTGQVRLRDNGDSTWNVDSFFDVAYEIEFVGSPGSALEGLGGTATGNVRLDSGPPPVPVPSLSRGRIGLVLGLLAAAGAVFGRRVRREV